MKQQQIINTVSSWYKTEGWYKQLLYWEFKVLTKFLKGKTLLEVGPADGVMTGLLTGYFKKITLLEPSRAYASHLKKTYPQATVIESLLDTFHSHKTYDMVVIAHVLEHIPKPVPTLKKLIPAMRKQSRLLIVVPNATSPHRYVAVALGKLPRIDALNKRDKNVGHQRVYSLPLLLHDVKQAGFSVIQSGKLAFGADIYCVATKK